MNRKLQFVFLLLVLTQAAHSCEEYFMKLYEVLAPARFVSRLVSDDLQQGFAAVNAGIVLCGLWCWLMPVRSQWRSARGVMWFWAVMECGNGTGHLVLAVSRGGYFPGAATAPALLIFATWLAVLQARRLSANGWRSTSS